MLLFIVLWIFGVVMLFITRSYIAKKCESTLSYDANEFKRTRNTAWGLIFISIFFAGGLGLAKYIHYTIRYFSSETSWFNVIRLFSIFIFGHKLYGLIYKIIDLKLFSAFFLTNELELKEDWLQGFGVFCSCTMLWFVILAQ